MGVLEAMVARVSIQFPPAGQPAPDAESREKGLRDLRLEIEAQTDPALLALLQHDLARLHERRDDLASAARDELAATKQAAGFIEPLESLVGVAIRSRSSANLSKLLARLEKLSRSEEELLRASLALAQTQLAGDDPAAARSTLEAALETAPSSNVLWLALEATAGVDGDRSLLLKAAIGRAAHARSPDLRCLLLERVARLQADAGNSESAFDSLKQSVDEVPTWRALRSWEHLALQLENFEQAREAARQTAKVIQGALEQPDDAPLHQIPALELSARRALSATLRAIAYSLKLEDTSEAIRLLEQLCETTPTTPLLLALRSEIFKTEEDRKEANRSLLQLTNCRNWDEESQLFLRSLTVVSALDTADYETLEAASNALLSEPTTTNLARLLLWKKAEESGDLSALITLIGNLNENGSGEVQSFQPAISLLHLLSGAIEEAHNSLEPSTNERAVDDSYGSEPVAERVDGTLTTLAMRRMVQQLRGDHESEIPLLRELIARLKGEETASALAVELLRLELLSKKKPDPRASTLNASPWGQLVAALLSGDRGNLKYVLDSTDETVEGWQHFRVALELFLGRETIGTSPLEVGARLARAEKEPGALLSLAQEVEEDLMGQSLRLRAILGHVVLAAEDQRWATAAEQAASDAATRGSESAAAMLQWIHYARTKDDVGVLLQHLADSRERRLLFASHLVSQNFDSASWESGDDRSMAEELLTLLVDAGRQNANSDENSRSPISAGAQRAARLALESTPDRQMDQAKAWFQASGHSTALFSYWFAAALAANPSEEAAAFLEISDRSDDIGLASFIDAHLLSEEDRLRQSAILARVLPSEKEGTTPNGAAQAAWAALELRPIEMNSESAASTAALAMHLDRNLRDPDAQLAQLTSGFQLLVAGDYDSAVVTFEKLYQVIPSDLTLCQGLRLAGEKANRPDLEVQATCELARHVADNHSSASLWERAGTLYQDHLNSLLEAEECFANALVRSPGSPLSFERVYRFARSRNDQKRQIELLDMRLDNAESETLRIELYWEKARLCRMLGKRANALRSIEELLELAPDHLSSLALLAELHLVDNRQEASADALRRVATHPDTPDGERRSAGLFACDLFEKLNRPQQAVELLQTLDELGVKTPAALERKARSHARAENWGPAFQAFCELNDEQDAIESRLVSARMMLAIQRDHLRQPEELKDATRRVLRDCPDDDDAVSMVLELAFGDDERRRLLAPARETARRLLLNTPLDPQELLRFAKLCENCGDNALERVALGLKGLTGKLPEESSARLFSFHERCPRLPSHPWTTSDLQQVADAGQLGTAGELFKVVAPYIAQEIEPTLEALGITSPMRIDVFSDSEIRNDISIWMGAFGITDFELYVGGSEVDSIRVLEAQLPTVIIGEGIVHPMSRPDLARLVAQLSIISGRFGVLLNHKSDVMEHWMSAIELLCDGDSIGNAPPNIEEMARRLSNAVSRSDREQITEMYAELRRTDVRLTELPYAVHRGACKAAALAYGEPTIVRQLPEFIPQDETRRNFMMSQLAKFCLTDEFAQLRMKAGLEGA